MVGCGEPPLGSTVTPAPCARRGVALEHDGLVRPGGISPAETKLPPGACSHIWYVLPLGAAARLSVTRTARPTDFDAHDGHGAAVGEGLLVALRVRRLQDLGGDVVLDLRRRVPRLGGHEGGTAAQGDDRGGRGEPPVPAPAGIREPGHPGGEDGASASWVAACSRLVASMRSPASWLTAGASGRTLAMSRSTCSRSRSGGRRVHQRAELDGGLPEAGDLGPAVGAVGQVPLELGALDVVERRRRRRRPRGRGCRAFVAVHELTPSVSRRRISPSRIRVLAVPSGRSSIVATSVCV